MRFLFLLLLCSLKLTGQNNATSSDKYVWAKSGLVLRAEGNLKGKKLATLPYGAAVQLTGGWGEDLSINVIPEREVDGAVLPGWDMSGQFISVRYGELEGYAFNGYISNYNPADFIRTAKGRRAGSGFTVIDTLHFLRFPEGSENEELSVLYRNSITENSYWDKAGGGGTIVIPNATLATGYLLATEWFGLDQQEPNQMEWDIPQLISQKHDTLTFKRDLLEITIKEYFGVIIILYDQHC